MNELTVVTLVLLGASCMVSVVALIGNARASAARKAATAAYFESRYGSSVDRMVAESPADREQLRSIRDSGRSGPVKATRELLRSEPVPLDAAAEFVSRI